MHTYATNFPWHPRLVMGMTLVAVAISSAIGWACAQIEGWWGFSIGGVSSIAIFCLIYFLFDQYLWRKDAVRRFLLVPDLNGNWLLVGKTVVKNGENVEWPWEGEIKVAQSWSKISVVLRTSQSTSVSIAASLYREPPLGYRLIYHYDNKPGADQANIRRHSGLCNILFDGEVSHGEGQYFTDRDRLTVGTLKLTRQGRVP